MSFITDRLPESGLIRQRKEGAEVGAELIPVSTTILPERNLVDNSRKQAVF